MATKYIYTDGNTQTPCRTRKQAIAFLIVQNGGEVWTGDREHLMARIVDVPSGRFLEQRLRKDTQAGWEPITPKMREAAQEEIGSLVPRKCYLIDFVYADTHQQFGTGADLTPDEVGKLEEYLQTLVDGGYIVDPHVYRPSEPTHQTYAQARKEIAAAIRS